LGHLQRRKKKRSRVPLGLRISQLGFEGGEKHNIKETKKGPGAVFLDQKGKG